jgi:macrodomain Ter protein organizer (MatP/YcbG family)
MPRPKYRITNSTDYRIAIRYLEQKVQEPGWIGGNARAHGRAAAAFPEHKRGFDNLNDWCEKWMSSDNWTQLKNAIRTTRMRSSTKASEKPVNVTLSRKAHRILTDLADYEGITMSEYIEKRLKSKWLNTPTSGKL